MLWLTSTGLAGDGFTPGGTATITISSPTGAQLSSQREVAGNVTGGLVCFYSPSGTKICHDVPYNYSNLGQVSETTSLVGLPCTDNTITATDLTTGESYTSSPSCSQ